MKVVKEYNRSDILFGNGGDDADTEDSGSSGNERNELLLKRTGDKAEFDVTDEIHSDRESLNRSK